MFRKTILSAAAAIVAASPIVAQAAPERAPASLSAEKEALAGDFAGILWPVLVAVALGLAVVLLTDSDGEPVSP